MKVLSTGAKISFIIAALLALLAAYFYLVPVSLTASDGKLFGCGSAANPPTEQFPVAICGSLAQVNMYRTSFLLGAALLVGVSGYALFGARSQTERGARRGDA